MIYVLELIVYSLESAIYAVMWGALAFLGVREIVSRSM